MMVSMTLLAVIMVGLLTMFNQTQKALHLANTQTDVFENARGAVQIVTRDLMEMTAYNDINAFNFYCRPVQSVDSIDYPNGSVQPYFDEVFWLSRANDEWQGIGYFVEGTNSGVGTLYRFSRTVRQDQATNLFGDFRAASLADAHRVSDGIVHFKLEAVHVVTNIAATNFVRSSSFEFSSNDLPAFVDMEIGVLEPATLKRFQALTNDVNASISKEFLKNHANEVHFFRERVPIRNFINPYRSNEVP